MLKDKTTLYIVYASLLTLVVSILIAYLCYHFHLYQKKKKTIPSPSNNGKKEVLEYNSLRFTYNTNIEPLQTHYPSEGDRRNPLDDSSNESNFVGGAESENLLMSIDLIQPTISRSTSKSSSECSELVDVVLVDNTNKSLRYHGKPTSLHHNGLGKLSAALFFDKTLEILRVNVIQWYNVGSKGIRSTLSPYVKVQLLPDLERKFFTKTKREENPIFDEEFSFPVKELKDRTVHLSISDFDKFSRQNIIANGFIKLEEHQEHISLQEGTGEFWIDLTESDEISIKNKGDISFSLSYFPTSNRITLTIVKAKNLDIEMNETRVAVKASLLFGEKVGKTRKTSYHQSDISNPVFNETWAFDIPDDVLNQTSFLLCVYAYSHNKKRVIGTAKAGSQVSSKTGLAQWNEMLLQSRDPILHWHKLV